ALPAIASTFGSRKMNMTVKKRSRLSPHARRMQLLDCASEIIQEQGLSNLTMEFLAKRAGVSNPLIYKYFDTRLEILQELLQREFERYSKDFMVGIGEAVTYEEIVTFVVTLNFEDARKGNILSILRNQPDIKTAIEKEEASTVKQVGVYLVKKMAETYPLTRRQAEQLVLMSSGASQAAAASKYNTKGAAEKKMIGTTVGYILGGIGAFLSSEESN
ncbi:MAG: TetR/AcrR family transcriptional regulator, partial [Halioglobus sp.]